MLFPALTVCPYYTEHDALFTSSAMSNNISKIYHDQLQSRDDVFYMVTQWHGLQRFESDHFLERSVKINAVSLQICLSVRAMAVDRQLDFVRLPEGRDGVQQLWDQEVLRLQTSGDEERSWIWKSGTSTVVHLLTTP